MLLQIVRGAGPPTRLGRALDVGCGAGAHSFRLATHFGLQVLGVDPVQRHLDLAREARRDVPEEIASRVTFGRGSATELPVADSSADLVWCRDALAPSPAGRRLRRVRARPAARWTGRIHQLVATPLLSSAEAAWLFPVMGVVPSSMSSSAPTRRCGARVWWSMPRWTSGPSGVSTPRRSPAPPAGRCSAPPGSSGTRTAIGRSSAMRRTTRCSATALWQVYLMLGKLSGRILVLTRPVGTV